ncbi:MAG: hypothetical protein KAJ19_29580, partial [Gammaproteobacteria bacterium]|nr:hypothetical protein [Gammaproteobacteria bacterium]
TRDHFKMHKPRNRAKSALETDARMKVVCEEMINEDVTLTLRAVSRRLVISASVLSRDETRQSILSDAQNKQQRLRAWHKKLPKQSRAADAKALAAKDTKITELEGQKQLLIASHKAMIMAIGEVGGMRAWKRFFDEYQHVLEELNVMGAIPSADIKPFNK